MFFEPKLPSFCIKPESDKISKFTQAHEYLETHPYINEQIIKKSCFRNIKRIPNFRVEISNKDLNGQSVDVDDICNLLIYWDLTDAIDFSIGNDFFIFVFRSAVSAYVSSKIPRIISRVIDEIPKNSRVPIVYVQGIGKNVDFKEIEQFFRNISPILKIKFIEK